MHYLFHKFTFKVTNLPFKVLLVSSKFIPAINSNCSVIFLIKFSLLIFSSFNFLKKRNYFIIKMHFLRLFDVAHIWHPATRSCQNARINARQFETCVESANDGFTGFVFDKIPAFFL